jgi:16S rRNA processing protein RimM
MVPIGKVLKTRGLTGELVVFPYLTDLSFYRDLQKVVVYQDDGSVRHHGVQQAQAAGEQIRLRLEGYSSCETVRPLVGRELHVPRDELPPVAEHTFYWFDLAGLSVYTETGEYVGHIDDFFPTGSNEVLVVRDGARESLLPFIKDIILAIDTEQGWLRVRAIPGLL